MCLPKPPKPDRQAEAYSRYESVQAAQQAAQAETDAAAIRAQNKDERTEQRLAQLAGKMGRRSLFSRADSGAGFVKGRSMFAGGATPTGRPALPGSVGTPAPVVVDPVVGGRRGGVSPKDRGLSAPRSLFGDN